MSNIKKTKNSKDKKAEKKVSKNHVTFEPDEPAEILPEEFNINESEIKSFETEKTEESVTDETIKTEEPEIAIESKVSEVIDDPVSTPEELSFSETDEQNNEKLNVLFEQIIKNKKKLKLLIHLSFLQNLVTIYID